MTDRFKATVFHFGDRQLVTLGEHEERLNFARRIRREVGANPTGQHLLDWFRTRIGDEGPDAPDDPKLGGSLFDLICLFSRVELPTLTDEERQIVASKRAERQSKFPDWEDIDFLQVHVADLLKGEMKS